MTNYEKFYHMLDMIPVTKILKREGRRPPELSQKDLDDLAEIYDILLVPEGASKEEYQRHFEDALKIVINISLQLNKGTKAIGGSKKNNSIPPVGADAIPEEIKRSIYFITYVAYIYKFGMDRKNNLIPRAGYQAGVLDKIKELSNERVSFGYNSWTKWGMHPEYDFIEGTYVPYKLPFRYMGQKNADLLFMMKFIAESVNYSSFADLFGGSGVCSLARANNSSVDEYINDFDYRNVCFYLAMTKYFDDFEKACLELKDRIYNHNLPQNFYTEGDEIWTCAIERLCVKLNKLIKNMERSYNNSLLPRKDRVEGISSEPAGKVLDWSKMDENLFEPFDWTVVATPENISELTFLLTDYINKGLESSCYLAFEVFSDELKKIVNTLTIKEIYGTEDSQKTIKYAIGVFRYFEKLKEKLAIGLQLDITGNSIPFDMEYAVAFIYMRLFMQVKPSVSWVNIENLSKFDDVITGLKDIQPRFKTLGVLWADAIQFLNRPNEVSKELSKIHILEKEVAQIAETDPVESMNKIMEVTRLKSELSKWDIFTDAELSKLTRKELTDNLEKTEYTIEYYRNMLVYLDSPYISTEDYAGDGFDFDGYREAVDNFIGKYIYSCRFSAKTSNTSSSENYDIDIEEKAESKSTSAIQEVQTIYNYYRCFKSVKYVCMIVSSKAKSKQSEVVDLKQYILDNLFTDKLEVMLTNFDFKVPNSEYQNPFSNRISTEFEFDAKIREQNESKFYKLDFETFMGYVKEAILKKGRNVE